MAGRERLVREVAAAPGATALREALRLSDTHVQSILARLEVLAPPERRTRDT